MKEAKNATDEQKEEIENTKEKADEVDEREEAEKNNQKEFEDMSQGSVDGSKLDTETDTAIYRLPSKKPVENGQEDSLDDMMNDADSFINQGAIKYNETDLQNFSKTMYNILLAVGVAIAVIIGGIIGIKLMTASVEEKAQVKELLVPYIVGRVIIFGGFAIWKLVVTILEGM